MVKHGTRLLKSIELPFKIIRENIVFHIYELSLQASLEGIFVLVGRRWNMVFRAS
jgi:hypothetical protein